MPVFHSPTPHPVALPPAPHVSAQERAKVDVVEPTFPTNFVGCPQFSTNEGTQMAGTAFLAKRPGDEKVYLLTAHHLLGPSGGFKELVRHEDVPNFVLGIQFNVLFGSSIPYVVHGCYVHSGDDIRDPLFDLAVFKTEGASAADAVVLAEKMPFMGWNVIENNSF